MCYHTIVPHHTTMQVLQSFFFFFLVLKWIIRYPWQSITSSHIASAARLGIKHNTPTHAEEKKYWLPLSWYFWNKIRGRLSFAKRFYNHKLQVLSLYILIRKFILLLTFFKVYFTAGSFHHWEIEEERVRERGAGVCRIRPRSSLYVYVCVCEWVTASCFLYAISQLLVFMLTIIWPKSIVFPPPIY